MSEAGLRRLTGAARFVLVLEVGIPALLPAALVLAGLLSAAWLGLLAPLPGTLRFAVALGALGLTVWLVWRGLRAVAWPDRQSAERRLEAESGLRHQPLSVLRDRAAAGEPALWAAHQAWAAASLVRLRLPGPRPDLARHDPFALRAGAAVLLLAGLVVAGGRAPQRLAALFAWPGAGASGPAIEAWVTPPAYTGRAPILLASAGGEATVPAGSRLTVAVNGGGAPRLALPEAERRPTGPASWEASAVLDRGGPVRLVTRWRTLATWRLTLLANAPPTIAWNGAPGPAPAERGEGVRTRFPWHVAQRWGVAALAVELRLPDRPELGPHLVTLPLPGRPQEASGAATPDLSADPWAGLTVSARLIGRDVSGQAGSSGLATLTLPARRFHDPLARALIALRQRLALHPERRDAAASDLGALGDAVPARAGQAGTMLAIAATAALLSDPLATRAVEQTIDRLWTLALALDGSLPSAAERRLQAAREALRSAMHDPKTPRSEIERRVEALRQALNDRLRELERQARRDNAILTVPPGQHALSEQGLQKQLDALRDAARQGRTEEAEQKLAQLERMLDRLKNAKPMSREQAERARRGAQEGRKQLGAMQDLVKRETELLDRAQGRAPAPPALPPQFRFYGDEGETPPPLDADRSHQQEDARTQRALRRALGAARDHFDEAGGKVPPTLGEADQAMADAARALAAGRDDAARSAEQRAIEALQKGGQEMGRQMAQNQGQGGEALQLGQQGQGEESDQAGENEGSDEGGRAGQMQGPRGRDPLGRRVTGNGRLVGDDPTLHVPETMERGRSQAIQEELRRREEDRTRPQQELDYIDRLLKPF